jgi:ankyrin repeat protein
MSRKRRSRILLRALLIPVVCTAGLAAYTTANMQRQKMENEFHHAVTLNDHSRAMALLEQGVNPNARWNYEPPASFWNTFVKIFRPGGQDSIGAGQNGPPFLTHAVLYSKNLSLIRAMLDKGADVNIKGPTDLSPLSAAAYSASDSGNTQVLELLLDRGADVNWADGNGITLLHILAPTKEEEVVKRVLAKGANANAKRKDNVTPLMLAAQMGRSEIAKALCEAGADVNAVDEDDRSALIYALGDGASVPPSPKVVDILIKHGVDVNRLYATNYTPLIYASMNCHAEAVKILLARGANPAAKDKRGYTALSGAKDPIIRRILQEALAKRGKKKQAILPAHPLQRFPRPHIPSRRLPEGYIPLLGPRCPESPRINRVP